MNEVFNLSRSEVRYFRPERECIWISIGEPCTRDGLEFIHVSNKWLDESPNLKLKFWDTERPLVDLSDPVQKINPPSAQDAAAIVDFILEHPNKDVIVNCAAGVSRSGAVAQFCNDVLGYEWYICKKRAVPNRCLYKLMLNYYRNPTDIQYFCGNT